MPVGLGDSATIYFNFTFLCSLECLLVVSDFLAEYVMTFDIYLKDQNDQPLTGSFNAQVSKDGEVIREEVVIVDENGHAKINLSSNETMNILNIPYMSKWSVSEVVNEEDFIVVYLINDEVIDTRTTNTVNGIVDTINSSTVTVENYVKYALPETGGMGTTIFTVLGIIIMVGAAAFFTSRKRSSVA